MHLIHVAVTHVLLEIYHEQTDDVRYVISSEIGIRLSTCLQLLVYVELCRALKSEVGQVVNLNTIFERFLQAICHVVCLVSRKCEIDQAACPTLSRNLITVQ